MSPCQLPERREFGEVAYLPYTDDAGATSDSDLKKDCETPMSTSLFRYTMGQTLTIAFPP